MGSEMCIRDSNTDNGNLTESFIEHGANVNMTDINGNTPLHVSAKSGKLPATSSSDEQIFYFDSFTIQGLRIQQEFSSNTELT